MFSVGVSSVSKQSSISLLLPTIIEFVASLITSIPSPIFKIPLSSMTATPK